jgi:hypothetical protein
VSLPQSTAMSAPAVSVVVATTVDELVFKARLAEQAERYEEMADFMKRASEKKPADLSADERQLLSIAYKNAIGTRRAACRTVHKLELKEKSAVETARKDGKVLTSALTLRPRIPSSCSDVGVGCVCGRAGGGREARRAVVRVLPRLSR